ncbi:MAG: DNA-J related domain-containing protein [Aeromonadaceae bacterium]
MNNPLLEPLLELLRQGGVCKLHELMSRLRADGWLPQWPLPAEQQLFRTNFLLMNGLYQLQARLVSEGIWLEVAPLSLTLVPLEPGQHCVMRRDPLRDYYLDWQIFWQTEVAEIEALLRSFWQGYCGTLQPAVRTRALAELGLDDGASPQQIRRRWKRLALRYHPDRPQGDAARFVAINLAWEQLRETQYSG